MEITGPTPARCRSIELVTTVVRSNLLPSMVVTVRCPMCEAVSNGPDRAWAVRHLVHEPKKLTDEDRATFNHWERQLRELS